MAQRRRGAPVWLMGLSNATFGMFGGVAVVTIPQLLAARHVPEATIAGMTAVLISPGFWSFLFAPMLDVRFSRRWYSVVTAVLASLLMVLGFLNLNHLLFLEAALTLGYFSANLYQSALGGWLSSITTDEEESQLSVWVTVGNIAAGGLMAMLGSEVVRYLPLPAAALALGAAVLLPIAVFPWMEAPGPDRRLARESFAQFFAEVLALLRRREVLVAIVLFLVPAGTFSLTNMLGGMGNDFHAPEHLISLVGGAGVLVGGLVGCFAFPLIHKLLPLRWLYLAIAAVGAAFTLALLLLPRTPGAFAAAMIGENMFQALAITCSINVAFETIGRNNPLAATTYSLIIAAFNIPITYMLFVDGKGYAHGGIAGTYAIDAGASLLAIAAMVVMLLLVGRRKAPGLTA